MSGIPRIALEKELEVLLHFVRAEAGIVHNPSDVANASHGRLSRPGAKASMERLAEAGMLKRVERRARKKKEPTPHYSLPRTRAKFRQIAIHFFSNIEAPKRWQARLGMDLLDSPWARELLDADFVMEVLAQREVNVSFYLPSAKPRQGDDRLSFPEYVFVHCQPSVKATAEQIAKEAAKEGFDPVSNSVAEALVLSRLVVPILSLLKTSPRAIMEFLGDWEPADNSTVGTMEPLEHVLFRLIFGTISDIAEARLVPGGGSGEITLAAVCPQEAQGGNGETPLLTIHWDNGLVVAYRANFDTDEMVYGEELVVVEHNPENCWTDFWYHFPQRHYMLADTPDAPLVKALKADPELLSKDFVRLV